MINVHSKSRSLNSFQKKSHNENMTAHFNICLLVFIRYNLGLKVKKWNVVAWIDFLGNWCYLFDAFLITIQTSFGTLLRYCSLYMFCFVLFCSVLFTLFFVLMHTVLLCLWRERKKRRKNSCRWDLIHLDWS